MNEIPQQEQERIKAALALSVKDYQHDINHSIDDYSLGYKNAVADEYLHSQALIQKMQRDLEYKDSQIEKHQEWHKEEQALIKQLREQVTAITEIGYRYYLKLNTIAKGAAEPVEIARGILSQHDAMFDPNAEQLLKDRYELDEKIKQLQEENVEQAKIMGEYVEKLHALTLENEQLRKRGDMYKNLLENHQ